jgi:hypothetical protein
MLVTQDPQRTQAHEETFSLVNNIECFSWSPEAPAQKRADRTQLSDRLSAARKCGGEELTRGERHVIVFTDTL